MSIMDHGFEPLPPYADPREALRQALPALSPAEEITVTAAAEKYMRVNVAGQWLPFRREVTPYMVEPTDMIASREYRSLAFCGPSQSGKTQMLQSASAYAIAANPGRVALFQMTRDSAALFEREKLAPMINNSPALRDRVARGRGSDTIFQKLFVGGTHLTLDWPTVTKLSSATIRLVLGTDYDHFPKSIGGEGDAHSMMRARTRTFMSRGMVAVESSPGAPLTDENWRPETPHAAPPVEYGVLALYPQGTRGRWYWSCPHCADEFEPTFARLDYPKGLDPAEAAVTARMQCPHCGALIGHEHKAALNAGGRWLHESSETDPETGQPLLVPIDSGRVRRTDMLSYWLDGAAAAFSTWAELVEQYENAIRAFEATGDEEKLKTAMNTGQAQPYILVTQPGVLIDNPRLLWNGALTYGAGQDFLKAGGDGDETTFDVSDARFGSSNSYPARTYCSGVLVLEADGCIIRNIVGRSASGDHTQVIHNWVSAARMGGLVIDGAQFDDCVMGILTQGGVGNTYISNIRGGRLNQDVGIPGHLVYSYGQGQVIVDGVFDDGQDTTQRADYRPMHSVSLAGGVGIITNVRSKRAAGPLDCRFAGPGYVVSNIQWTYQGDYPSGYVPPSAPFRVLHDSVSGISRQVLLANVSLDAGNYPNGLVGAAPACIMSLTTNGLVGRGLFVRRDSSGKSDAWLNLRGGISAFDKGFIDLEATLVEMSTTRTPVIQSNTLLQDSDIRLKLRGWGDSPVAIRCSNDLTLRNNIAVEFLDARTPEIGVGSPDSVWPISSNTVKVNNTILVYPDMAAQWSFDNAAGATAVASVPLRSGNFEVAITIYDLDLTGSVKTELYHVWATRPTGHTNASTGSVQVGSTRGVNPTRFGAFTLTPNLGGFLAISIPVSDATVQTHATRIVVEMRKLSRV